jgi:hypothetical protein
MFEVPKQKHANFFLVDLTFRQGKVKMAKPGRENNELCSVYGTHQVIQTERLKVLDVHIDERRRQHGLQLRSFYRGKHLNKTFLDQVRAITSMINSLNGK